MSQSPLAALKIDFPDLAITTTDEKHVFVDAAAEDTVRSKGHRSSVHLLADAKDTDLSTLCTCEEHIAIDQTEVVVPDETSVRQLAGFAGKEILHRGNIKLQLVDDHLILVSCHERIGRVLGVDSCIEVAPFEQ